MYVIRLHEQLPFLNARLAFLADDDHHFRTRAAHPGPQEMQFEGYTYSFPEHVNEMLNWNSNFDLDQPGLDV